MTNIFKIFYILVNCVTFSSWARSWLSLSLFKTTISLYIFLSVYTYIWVCFCSLQERKASVAIWLQFNYFRLECDCVTSTHNRHRHTSTHAPTYTVLFLYVSCHSSVHMFILFGSQERHAGLEDRKQDTCPVTPAFALTVVSLLLLWSVYM